MKTGGRVSFLGRGGAGTGKPADLAIIDDPLKNAIEAESPTSRKALHDWFSKTVYARAKTSTAIIVIQTRWNEDDLIGRLCDPDHPDHDKELAAEWTYLNIPAVVSDPALADALGYKLEVPADPMVLSQFGGAPICSLWPERFTLRHLATAKKLNPVGFSALYMGKPSPDDGHYFKREHLVEYDAVDLPRNLRKYGASDHATSAEQQNDADALGCIGVDDHDHIWVLPDVVWDRMETDAMVEEMIDQMARHQPMLWWAENEMILKSIGPFLRKRMQERKVYTPLDPITPAKELRIRARSIQGRMMMGMVHFPRFAPWWSEAKAQMLRFPFGAHDDFVSMMALFGLGLTKELKAPAADAEPEKIVKVGSIAWIRAQTKRRDAVAKSERRVAGW